MTDFVIEIRMQVNNGQLDWIKEYGHLMLVQVYTDPYFPFNEPNSD